MAVEHLDDEVTDAPEVPHPTVWGWGGAMVGFAAGQIAARTAEGPAQTLSLLGALVAGLFCAWIAHGLATAQRTAHQARLDAIARATRHVPVDAMALRMARMALPVLRALVLEKPAFFPTTDTWRCTMLWRADSHRMEPWFRYESAAFRLQRVRVPRYGAEPVSINLGTGDSRPRSPVPLPSLTGKDAADWDVFCTANPVVHVSLEGLRIGASKHALLSLVAGLEAFAHATERRLLEAASAGSDGKSLACLSPARAHVRLPQGDGTAPHGQGFPAASAPSTP